MDEINLIKSKINIVDLLQEYLPLKKAGANFKANCPFHNEKTPSFMVSPERGIWHCFGCQKGGDHYKFLMEKEGIEFKEALEVLAKKAGITLTRIKKPKDHKDRLFEANQKAQQFFNYLLTKHKVGKKALEYLKERGLTDQIIEEFGLGYAPLNWETLSHFLKKRGFDKDELVLSGLSVPSQKGSYDRFRGRITFPLIDNQDRIIGFSGRIIDKGEPKYINTPATAIFDKSKFLYGLNLAKTHIRGQKQAIVVEGEMDMILSYQSGIKNIVASKGTALTEEQISLLQKFTDEVSLCFDTDFAGDAAARRGIEIIDKLKLNIKIIQVVGGKDPAEVCLKDPSSWKEMVENAIPIYDYYLNSVRSRFNPKTAEGKKSIFGELLPIWKKISDPIMKEHYIQKLAFLLQVKEDLVRGEVNKGTSFKTPLSLEDLSKEISTPSRRRLLEEYLLTLLLHIPIDKTYVPSFPETLFTEEHLKEVYILLVLYLDGIYFKGYSFKINEFIATLPEELVSLADNLYLQDIDTKLIQSDNWQKELDIVVGELKKMLIKSSLEKLSLEIKSAQNFDRMEALEALNKRFRDLSLKLKNL